MSLIVALCLAFSDLIGPLAMRKPEPGLEQTIPALGGMIDSPTPFESLEVWQEHLSELHLWPDSGVKRLEVAHAEQIIAEKKREARK